jgi:formate-dependent nitrite reductase membrane component NrfD
MHELDIARHSRMIDPALAIWGWEIPVYLFLGGLAAGVLILTALPAPGGVRSRALRWLAFAPLALVTAGMGALFLDLGQKVHVVRFFLAFRWTSPMSWGAWILLLVYPAALLVALAGLEDAEAARLARGAGPLGSGVRALRSLARAREGGVRRAGVVAGVALGVYTGILLSTLGARPLWGSALLGPLFLASGVSTGAALLLLAPLSDEERHRLARWDRALIAVELALLALFLAGLATGGAAAQAAAGALLGGPYTAPFFALVVVAGLGVPLLLGVLEVRLRLRATAAAPALVLVGGLALRVILVAAGQAV